MKLLGWVVAAASTVAVALLSGVPIGAERESALLRLSWRARGEEVRACRQRSAAELERLPVHMRQKEVCERHILPYRLQVMLDSALVIDEAIRAGGAHEDRPLFVFFEQPLAPGTHRLHVSFALVADSAGFHRSEEEGPHEARETPPFLTLDQPITLAPGAVVVVTYDDERKVLRLLAAPSTAP